MNKTVPTIELNPIDDIQHQLEPGKKHRYQDGIVCGGYQLTEKEIRAVQAALRSENYIY